MIFSAIAGWFVKRFWPTGVLIAVLIAAANAIIQFFRTETVNSNRELAGLGANPNGVEVVLGGFAIDSAINMAVFAVVWALRRKFRPHSEASVKEDDTMQGAMRSDDRS